MNVPQMKELKGGLAHNCSAHQSLVDSLQQKLLAATSEASTLRQQLISVADNNVSINQVQNSFKLVSVPDVNLTAPFLVCSCSCYPVTCGWCGVMVTQPHF